MSHSCRETYSELKKNCVTIQHKQTGNKQSKDLHLCPGRTLSLCPPGTICLMFLFVALSSNRLIKPVGPSVTPKKHWLNRHTYGQENTSLHVYVHEGIQPQQALCVWKSRVHLRPAENCIFHFFPLLLLRMISQRDLNWEISSFSSFKDSAAE